MRLASGRNPQAWSSTNPGCSWNARLESHPILHRESSHALDEPADIPCSCGSMQRPSWICRQSPQVLRLALNQTSSACRTRRGSPLPRPLWPPRNASSSVWLPIRNRPARPTVSWLLGQTSPRRMRKPSFCKRHSQGPPARTALHCSKKLLRRPWLDCPNKPQSNGPCR